MAWLWLISVGVTDVQFPAWKKGQDGAWSVPERFSVGSGVRSTHEGLMALMENDRIEFPQSLPPQVDRNVAYGLTLDFEQDGADFFAAIHHKNYWISSHDKVVPNPKQDKLPLYIPKIIPLLDMEHGLFSDEPLTVVVLNTRRSPNAPGAATEPVASGPVVSRFLAERLHLDWHDNKGVIPGGLAYKASTWVDILVDDEAVEDAGAQQQVATRLTRLIRAWKPSRESGKIAITISGGIPSLKPFIERVPAICVGQNRVVLLDEPERGRAAVTALDYEDRVTERLILRFHCSEALRSRDFAAAYGLANRAGQDWWAKKVRSQLGPLLELSSTPLEVNGTFIKDSLLAACQIEICLCMHDIAGALKRLGTFLESSCWALIEKDARIHAARLRIDRADETLSGVLSDNHELVRRRLVDRNSPDQDKHRVLRLSWKWAPWLAMNEGRQSNAGKGLMSLFNAYNGEPRKYRNSLLHGCDVEIDLDDVTECLREARLLKGVGKLFGENFLSLDEVQKLLIGLGSENLAATINALLIVMLDVVTKGDA